MPDVSTLLTLDIGVGGRSAIFTFLVFVRGACHRSSVRFSVYFRRSRHDDPVGRLEGTDNVGHAVMGVNNFQ